MALSLRSRIPWLLWLILFSALAQAAQGPSFAVAANLTHPMADIVAAFRAKTGVVMRPSYGSSGDMTRQIEQGAPYQIFVSADCGYVHTLSSENRTTGDPEVIALGKLGAFVPAGSALADAGSLEGLFQRIAAMKFRRMAIANPEHAPFGRAAMQALQQGGIWAMERDRLLMAENVAQAVQYTLAGGVDVGFIPYSFAVLPDVASRGRFYMIPPDWYSPLEQCAVLLKPSGPEAQRFFDFLHSDRSRDILGRYGYGLPPPH